MENLCVKGKSLPEHTVLSWRIMQFLSSYEPELSKCYGFDNKHRTTIQKVSTVVIQIWALPYHPLLLAVVYYIVLHSGYL